MDFGFRNKNKTDTLRVHPVEKGLEDAVQNLPYNRRIDLSKRFSNENKIEIGTIPREVKTRKLQLAESMKLLGFEDDLFKISESDLPFPTPTGKGDGNDTISKLDALSFEETQGNAELGEDFPLTLDLENAYQEALNLFKMDLRDYGYKCDMMDERCRTGNCGHILVREDEDLVEYLRRAKKSRSVMTRHTSGKPTFILENNPKTGQPMLYTLGTGSIPAPANQPQQQAQTGAE